MEEVASTNMSTFKRGSDNSSPADNLRQSTKRQKIGPSAPNFEALRSQFYQLYNFDEADGKWECKICSKKYKHSTNGASASCGKHLLKHQMQIDAAGGIAELAALFNNNQNPIRNVPPPEITEEAYKNHLVNLVVSANLPFSVVKDEAFNNYGRLLSQNHPMCHNPSPPTLAKWIEDVFETKQIAVMNMLKSNPGKISFVLDCWTSKNQKPFQGVIACWINQEWELCHTPIDLSILRGSHTGKNLADSFSSVLDQYGLWKNILGITTDNASNMDTFFKCFEKEANSNLIDFDPVENRVRCMAHVINLACQAVVKSVVGSTLENDDLDDDSENEDDDSDKEPPTNLTFLDKIRMATRSIRGSPQRRGYFEDQCRCAGIKPKELMTDYDTRWKLTLLMLKRVLELKQPFLATCQFVKPLRKLKLHTDQEPWDRIKLMIKLLEPFEKATLKLSQGHSPTLSDVSSVYTYLFTHLESYTNSIDKRLRSSHSKSKQVPLQKWLIDAAFRGWEKLAKYYGHSDNAVNIIATVIPRYKLKYFYSSWTSDYYTLVEEKVNTIWNNYKQVEDSESPAFGSASSMHDEISLSVAEKLKGHYKPDDELKRYLNEPLVPMSAGAGSALLWWKKHSVSYPTLSKMAMDYLAVSATGVEVERLFSSGPDVLKTKQQSMKPETNRKRILLKQWLKGSNGNYKLDIMNDKAKLMLYLDAETTEC